MKQLYDVLIIGGGVVGSAIAREMSRYTLKIGVLEKNLDVCYETSGRNSGVVHGGFAYDTGSLKARLCVEGNKNMGQLAEELDFKFIRCGKVLVGSTEEDMETLKRTIRQGEANGAFMSWYLPWWVSLPCFHITAALWIRLTTQSLWLRMHMPMGRTIFLTMK